jgi:hypothetical protein
MSTARPRQAHLRWVQRALTAPALLVIASTACSPVWFLTRSDEMQIPLRLEDRNSQSVSFSPKFPGRRYVAFLRFDRTVSFEELRCLVGSLWEVKCSEPPVPVRLSWAVSAGDSLVAQGNWAPRTQSVGWANDYVQVFLVDFYPEATRLYRVAVQVIGEGGPLTRLRPKLWVLSYYNPLDKSIHASPDGNQPGVPNYSLHRTAYGGR